MKSDLRAWQRKALTKYLMKGPRDFLAVATPGAGKTTFALRVATELKESRTVDRIIVVVPTEHLKVQWAQSAARVGLSLDPYFKNSDAVNPQYDGIVVTYAQVAMHPFKHHAVSTAKRSLVIMDEIHHGGDAKSWGDGIRDAYGDVERRLALTGTPFRSDDSTIPFVRYEEDGEGHLVSQSDHTYGYSDALADGVVRPVVFLAYSGEARWRTNAGEEFAARLGEPLSPEQTARAWKTALDPRGDWIPAVLQAAHTRLLQLRKHIPDAGGLVIATDKTTARAYAKILESLSSTPVTVVLSDEAGASQRIEDFNGSTDEWMVAVRMVSEGVDVPRLAVGVYATSASTPLFFAQAIGRFVRSRRKGETASVFLPSVPVLLDLAAKLENSRDHVLGKPDRPSEGWDDELLAQANKEETEKDDLPSYESLGADAELDSLIYDGSSYGTGTFAGSDEEADYLGLPGLLDADQMRALLRKRQTEQLDARDAEAKQREKLENSVKVTQQQSEPAGDIASVEIPRLRKELNALVSVTASRTGRPHGAIHTEVRKKCGGPPTAMCSAEQLQTRIDYLRRW
ncbi:DEAD/DEAH box helicase [Corynebacterium pseudotuberculosis]|uniref:DEAD/DEAH box helicase family protein n=1 Tax=Corynebacterium pseudotuberculosis (strain C231) TaxID=681645 RepID=D9QAV5_CORP2|nr:DEAD/DEAH box helicase [Corynebacterium pseudotuberculosis]AER69256.1 Type III restriction endonuclease, res subunit [Corynebacterium pseudotuberculosis 1/06-A]ADK29006.1 DEAD/DEAH box helicase [Corynebacterium pseudotuberculosis FRC41]ADL10681.1 DEAD/DEAH box helicase family protein [Corynebacterium pseudotuberculosis C231]ADL21090.1 DEAD/DEAH box helicase [Corynebacterium pseudotuberculosis 1002]ADO26480.1 DEAD/DEAH box helicase [Corynebacterium pseudotuberculosis I19]